MTREEAKVAGLKRYNGSPCWRGHSGLRYTHNGGCIECLRRPKNGDRRGHSYKKGESPWTPAMIDHAIGLWKMGRNKRVIAELMPFECSTDAVIGLFWRLRQKGVDVPKRQ